MPGIRKENMKEHKMEIKIDGTANDGIEIIKIDHVSGIFEILHSLRRSMMAQGDTGDGDKGITWNDEHWERLSESDLNWTAGTKYRAEPGLAKMIETGLLKAANHERPPEQINQSVTVVTLYDHPESAARIWLVARTWYGSNNAEFHFVVDTMGGRWSEDLTYQSISESCMVDMQMLVAIVGPISFDVALGYRDGLYSLNQRDKAWPWMALHPKHFLPLIGLERLVAESNKDSGLTALCKSTDAPVRHIAQRHASDARLLIAEMKAILVRSV